MDLLLPRIREAKRQGGIQEKVEKAANDLLWTSSYRGFAKQNARAESRKKSKKQQTTCYGPPPTADSRSKTPGRNPGKSRKSSKRLAMDLLLPRIREAKRQVGIQEKVEKAAN